MEPAPYMPPKAPPSNAVTIVVAVDDNYVPHLAALIESIKASLSKERFLDFIVLDGGIKKENKSLINRQFFQNFENGSVQFIECKNLYKNSQMHSYFTETTLYRISIGQLLPNHAKALYLDTDIIVLQDISELFDIQLDGDYIVGAAIDVGMKGLQGKKEVMPRRVNGSGGVPLYTYLRDWLELKDEAENYFQAGVMLIDLEKFRATNIEAAAKKDLFENKYWFLDQDVLNKNLKNKVFYIDTSWNCLNVISDMSVYLPEHWKEKVEQDFLNPKIVHYAGFKEKPWNNLDAPLSCFYWIFMRRTFWYEGIIKNAKKLKKKKSMFSFFS